MYKPAQIKHINLHNQPVLIKTDKKQKKYYTRKTFQDVQYLLYYIQNIQYKTSIKIEEI